MLPEEKARERIDEQLREAGWKVILSSEYTSEYPCAVKEALMQGNKESDYLLFADNKAIAVLEAKCEENQLGKEVEDQVEYYAHHPRGGDGVWFPDLVPLVYISNGSDHAKLERLACTEGVTIATYVHTWLAEQE